MNGPEHYVLAEDWLRETKEASTTEEADACLRHAQVHATLALVAATALGSMNDMPAPEYNQWKQRIIASNLGL